MSNTEPIPKDLYDLIRKSWSQETCYPPQRAEWSEDTPSTGHCFVTALSVHNLCGGDIIMSSVKVPGKEKEILHLYNRFGTMDIDLTRDQFPQGSVVRYYDMNKPENLKLKERCLTNPEGIERFMMFFNRVMAARIATRPQPKPL